MRMFYTFILAGALFVGCDSGGGASDNEDPDSLVVTGRVEESGGYGKSMSDLEGAIVTAASIDAQGNMSAHSETATVDASGNYRLEIVGDVSDYVVLTATHDSHEARVVLKKRAAATSATAAPMNDESTGEADVFVASMVNAETRGLSYAQIAAYVTADVAAEIEAGAVTAAEIAAAVHRGREADEEYVDEEYKEADEKPVPARRQEEEDNAIFELQSALHTASSVSAESGALAAFDDAMVRAMAESGISAEASARARQSGRSAVVDYSANFSANAAFQLKKRADLYVSLATTAAVEAAFSADAAASSTIDALESAGLTLESAVASATTEAEIDAAFAAYNVAVDAQLSAHVQVTSEVIGAARTATDAARATLDIAVAAAVTVQATVDAHMSFYTAAEAAIATSLAGSASADMASSILATLCAR